MVQTVLDQSLGYIRLTFGTKWKYVACVRSFVQNFLTISINDPVKADKIALAVSELIENAVKYNSKEKTSIIIKLKDKDNILIESQNFATKENIKIFKSEIKKIYKRGPLEAYVEKMKEAVTKVGEASQLGLARIRCETNCDIRYKVVKDEILKIIAIFH